MANIRSIADLGQINDPAKSRLVLNTKTGELEALRVDGLVDRVMLFLAELFGYVDSGKVAEKFNGLVGKAEDLLQSKDWKVFSRGAKAYDILGQLQGTSVSPKGQLLRVKLWKAIGADEPSLSASTTENLGAFAEIAKELSLSDTWTKAAGCELADLEKQAEPLRERIALMESETAGPISNQQLSATLEMIAMIDQKIVAIPSDDPSKLFPWIEGPREKLVRAKAKAIATVDRAKRSRELAEDEIALNRLERRIEVLKLSLMNIKK